MSQPKDVTERIWHELHRIANALESLIPDQESPDLPCQHPPEMRTSFGTTQGQEDWLCRVCQFRTVPPSS